MLGSFLCGFPFDTGRAWRRLCCSVEQPLRSLKMVRLLGQFPGATCQGGGKAAATARGPSAAARRVRAASRGGGEYGSVHHQMAERTQIQLEVATHVIFSFCADSEIP